MAINFDYTQHLETVLPLLREIEQTLATRELDKEELRALQKKYNLPDGQMLSKTDIIAAYKALAGTHDLKPFDTKMVRKLRMKPIRTMSGVAPVTVLTKPFPCPGNCLFCPSDVRMPKSYLASEPGAQRAENNFFDPYLQTYNRIKTLHDMGHPVDKVELIVLGGTWSYYPLPYQIWFVTECFKAMNDFPKKDQRSSIRQRYQQFQQQIEELDLPVLTDNPKLNEQIFAKYQIHGDTPEKSYNRLMKELYLEPEQKVGLDQYQSASWDELEEKQVYNETAQSRCVGLVLETRPDQVTPKIARQLRRLGATKIQLGIQSLQDGVLEKNLRGHSVEQSAQAMAELRLAGFKLHIHWMPNLFGSTVDKDKKDYLKLFADERFKPDEIKIYPCALLESAGLMKYYQNQEWQPYTHDQLLEILSFCLLNTPEYCRVTRVVRDIPAFDIVAGNKKSNFRQIAQQEIDKLDQQSANIRAREIRSQDFNPSDVYLDQVEYQTAVSQEIFLQYVVAAPSDAAAGVTKSKRSSLKQPKILGFLRLSLSGSRAMIREIHVYGQMVGLGREAEGRAQHLGLGSKLIAKAKDLAREAGYSRLAVISAIGTKEYYRGRGFDDQGLYQVTQLD